MNQNLSTDLTPHFSYREQSTENEHNVNLQTGKQINLIFSQLFGR